MTHNDDSNDDDGGDGDGGASDGCGETSTLVVLRCSIVEFLWSYFPPPSSLGQMCEKGIFSTL